MKTRKLEGFSKFIFRYGAIAFSLIFLLSSGLGLLDTVSSRGFYILFNVTLSFMIYPIVRNKGTQKRIPWYDIILIILAIASFGYWMMEYENYVSRVTMPNKYDFWFGVIGIILLFEIARRVLGNTLLVVAGVFLLQLYFGPKMPGILAHPGFSPGRIVEFMYSSMEGVFGIITNTFATYVLPFIILGAFFEKSGAGNFFIKLSLSLTKGWAGGPAKVAVIASGIFGSISGSSVANVVSTGAFTIPMMKRVGFRAEEAGAIEAAASTGGQFLPPVMGAGAFLLATLTETPYITIITMNVIPALLYYYWVGAAVHFRAKKMNIGNLPDEEIPDFKETFKEGWFFVVPLILIFVMLFQGYSPNLAAFWAVISSIVLSWFTKKSKMGFKEILDGLELGGKNNLSVGSSIGMLGIVMGGIVLAGLGAKFGALIISLSFGNLFLAIALTAVVGIFVGMGATQTATYIIIAMIVVPGLQSLGVDKVVAHIIAFWFSAISNVTPPVCVAAFAAASIAEADPMKTGFVGIKYSFLLFVLPFTFHYFPGILMETTALDTIYIVVSMLIAIPAMAAGIMGYFINHLNWIQRALMFGAGLGLFFPGYTTDIIGAVIIVGMYLYQKKNKAELKTV